MRRYSEVIHEFIKANVKGRTTKELTDLLNTEFENIFTESKIKSYKKNHNLKSGTPTGNQKGKSKIFPQHIKDFITENCKGVIIADMANLLNEKFGTNYTATQICSYYKNNGITNGFDSKFHKGHKAHNKGKKGYCSPGSEKGWFSKGHLPLNYRSVGSERIDVDGYTYIKIADPNKWIPKHKYLWEKANGKVPVGHVITFLDGDKLNLKPDNFALITMAESLQLTRMKLRSSDAAQTKSGILISKIKVAAHKRKKRTV